MQFFPPLDTLAALRKHRFQLQGAGNGVVPVLKIGHGVTLTLTATGRVKFVWTENPGTFVGIDSGHFRDNTSQATIKNWEVSAGGYPLTAGKFDLEVDIWNSGGALADLATTSFLDLCLVFSELKVP